MSPNGLSSQEEEANESILGDLTSTLHFVTPSQAAKLMQQVKDEDLIFRLVAVVYHILSDTFLFSFIKCSLWFVLLSHCHLLLLPSSHHSRVGNSIKLDVTICRTYPLLFPYPYMYSGILPASCHFLGTTFCSSHSLDKSVVIIRH